MNITSSTTVRGTQTGSETSEQQSSATDGGRTVANSVGSNSNIGDSISRFVSSIFSENSYVAILSGMFTSFGVFFGGTFSIRKLKSFGKLRK